MGRLAGKVAIVTGASRGTGAVTARLFAEEGARVVLADVLDDLGRALADDLGDAGHFEHLDVTRPDEWARCVAAAESQLGPVDVLVNNAGVLLMRSIEETSAEDFERLFRVNQLGPFLGIQAVTPGMKARRAGSIVNISSVDGTQAKNGLSAYSATKWALRGITRVAALELGRFGVRVNAVCPEAGSGDMVRPYLPEGVDPELALAHGQPNLATQKERRIAERLRDVAEMVLFLASDASASCTGADFLVDGGVRAGHVVKGLPGA